MLGTPNPWHRSVEPCSDQSLAREEAQKTPNGRRRVLATHQGELLRPAAHEIRNLPGGEVAPVDSLIWKNTDE
jgi:hypothetical protein